MSGDSYPQINFLTHIGIELYHIVEVFDVFYRHFELLYGRKGSQMLEEGKSFSRYVRVDLMIIVQF